VFYDLVLLLKNTKHGPKPNMNTKSGNNNSNATIHPISRPTIATIIAIAITIVII